MTASSSIKRLIQHWQALEIRTRPPARPADIAQLEERIGVRLPPAMDRLYRSMDGMEEGSYDENLIRVWPVGEVGLASVHIPGSASARSARLLVFADYSVWAHAYAADLDSGAVVIVGGGGPLPIAPTFDAFLTHYASNPSALFGSTDHGS